MIPFLDLNKQYHEIREEMDRAIASVMETSSFVGGKFLECFEGAFAEYLGAKHFIGLGNGTDALEIALWALALPPGSEVIVPANTFIATSEAVTRSGLRVIFCDCLDDYTISPASLRDSISKNTSAVIIVHLYGQPCRIDEILDLTTQHGLRLIEDSAHAHGATWRGRKVGTFGDIGTFSFYPGKVLGAYGDAGGCVTNDDRLAERIRMFGNHGRSSRFLHEIEGRNSRLDGLQAAVLGVKLRHLDSWLKIRNSVAGRYIEALRGLPAVLPPVREDISHSWHLFVIRHPHRDDLKGFLSNNGIQTGIHYPFALPNLEPYKAVREKYRHFWACTVDKDLLSLPIGEHMTPGDADRVAEAIQRFGGSCVL